MNCMKVPPVNSNATEVFIKKYVNDPGVIGPFIRGGSRWFVVRRRRFSDIIDAIKHLVTAMSLKYLRGGSLNNAQYVKIRSINDLNTLELTERVVVEEFLRSRPWWLD